MSRAGPPCRRVMRSGNDVLVALPGRSLPPTWLLEQRSLVVSLAATKATREGSNGPSSQLSYGATANLDHQMQSKNPACDITAAARTFEHRARAAAVLIVTVGAVLASRGVATI